MVDLIRAGRFLGILLVGLVLAGSPLLTAWAGQPQGRWQQVAVLAAPEAFQAAAADERFVYAITNTRVARYDRETGKKLDSSSGPAEHLNSGFLHDGKLYCAHSNYPKKPDQSQIKVLDLDSMRLTTLHDFGSSPHGSLTWAVRHEGHWWCNFAHYGPQNDRTVLVKFNGRWQEQAVWSYPPQVVSDLGRYSISGGIWHDGLLLVTGHDKQVLYRLKLPADGHVLQYIDTVSAPFTGQGIAHDPQTAGLVGIHRPRREVVFARFVQSP